MTQTILSHAFSNGLTLVGEPMPSRESAAFTFLLPAGSAADPEDRAGVCEVLCDMLTRGAGERDGIQFINDLDNLGVVHGEGASHSYCTFSGSTVADRLYPALEMYADLLLRPWLPEDKLEHSRQVVLQDVYAVEDDPVQKMIQELRRLYFPHPYGRPTFGGEATLEAIAIDDVREFYARYFGPQGAILGVAGRFDWDDLRRAVDNLFRQWKPQQMPQVAVGERGGRQSHLPHASNQTHIGIVYPSVPYNHEDYFLASAGVGVLGSGMSSRLFTEVREKEGLCYAVFASYFSSKTEGGVYCYGASSPKTAQRTLDLMLRELARLREGIDAEELERLKARVLSGLVMQQESSRSRTSNIVLDWYHLGRARTLDEVEQIVQGLTCEQINDYLRRHPPAEFTIATIGPEPLEVPLAVS